MASGIPCPATVRHASFFNYQRQDEISNSQFLFHRQGEQFIPTTIRDVLPFFLGAVGADELEKKNELRRLQRELRQLERHLAELTAIQGEGLDREALRKKLAVVNEEIRSLKTLADDRLSSRVEANEQTSRLISLEMYPHSSDGNGSPVHSA